MHILKEISFVRASLTIIFISLIAVGIEALVTAKWSIVFVSVVTFALMLVPSIVQRRYEIKIPVSFAFPTVVFIYATLFLGEVGGLYDKFWWWDVAMHGVSAIGFGLIGFTILYMLYRAGKLDTSPWLIAIFTFSFALAIGGLWEIFEYIMDQNFGLNMQKSGLRDTMWDLIIDAVGAFVIAVSGFLHIKLKRSYWFTAPAERFVEENTQR